eukprot:TRINITY_DN276_c0_g1_i2.p1 TRINITY_DN276_c0_g1~~TRINITY_DN276_c0_g1_i2.p1  ORF type:complete len:716 (+),score=279.12 TRINITY_DN276_c0_g1_i2:792-2939(+)
MADGDVVESGETQQKFRVYNYEEAAKKFPEFKKDEIKMFIEAFEEFDADDSGSISASELSNALAKSGREMTPEKIDEMIAEADLDQSGEVDWPEYLAMMRRAFPWRLIQYEILYLEPARKFPEFSKEDIRVFAAAFREYDTDGSASISASELEVAFTSQGQGVTKEEVDEIVKEFDEDESGEIEFEEYLMMMRNFYPFKRLIFEMLYYGPASKYPEFSRSEIDVFINAFRDFDEDESGSIDAKELKDVFNHMGMGIDDEEAQMILEEVDEDKSGAIEWPEFLRIMAGFYPWKKIEYEFEFHIPARDFPEFSRREIDVFADAFREFDLDGSGSIDARELTTALKRMGQGASKERVQEIIDEVDDNGNGEIEWSEYLKIMRNFYPWKLEDFEKKYIEPSKKFTEFDREDVLVFVEAFREFDADNSGAIDVDELDKAFKSMGQGCSRERLEEIINEVDDNKNGVVDWPEFLTIMSHLYAGRDLTSAAPSAPAEKVAAPAKAESAPAKAESAPAKAAPAPATTPAKTEPAKTQAAPKTEAAPQQKQASTPAKTTSPTPVKAATSPTPAKSTAPASQPPAKSTFGQGKVTPSSSGEQKSSGSFGSHRANNACGACGKTVYPIEAMQANDQTWHKGCFKCQEEGCGLSLTLKTFKAAGGKIYCQKHAPVAKPTSVTVSGSLAASNAANAPKLSKAQGVKKNERMTFAPGELKPIGQSNDEE